jgi:hypothetical protein
MLFFWLVELIGVSSLLICCWLRPKAPRLCLLCAAFKRDRRSLFKKKLFGLSRTGCRAGGGTSHIREDLKFKK